MNRWALLLVGLAATLVGAALILGGELSGAQPWGDTLGNNMVFAKAIPFTIGLGVLVGLFRALGPASASVERRAGDGAIRRFAPGTVAMHWIATGGLMLGLATGAWLYLKGVLDVASPVPMALVYRLHYVGAALLLFSIASMLTSWWITGARALLVQPGQWIRHLRGLAHELPHPFKGILAGLLGLDMRRQSPPVEQFTYYEKTVSFPTWALLLGLTIATGLLKAMRYLYPIPGDLLWWASALHVAALVLLAAKLLDHLRYVLAPSRWSLLPSMVTTWIDERYVRARHAGWYETLADGRPAPPEQPPAPQETRPTVGSAAGDGP